MNYQFFLDLDFANPSIVWDDPIEAMNDLVSTALDKSAAGQVIVQERIKLHYLDSHVSVGITLVNPTEAQLVAIKLALTENEFLIPY